MFILNIKKNSNLKEIFYFYQKTNKRLNLSILFIGSFLFTSFFTYYYDLYKIDFDIYLFLGYFITHFFGINLIISNIKYKKFFNNNLILSIFLFILIASRILIDTNYINLIKVFFYKYGIFNYFIFGFQFFLASTVIKKYYLKRNVNLLLNLIIIFSFIFSLFVSIKFLGFDIDSNLKYGFYKETADNTYIIGLVLLSLANYLISEKNLLIQTLPILTIFNLAINSIITGSTSILIYFPFLLITSISIKDKKKFDKKNINKKFKYLFFIFIYVLFVVLITLYFNSHFNNSPISNSFFNNNSRLNINYLNEDIKYFFAPLVSRLQILSSFLKQFSINPILGNWNAEIISGDGEGYYMHSLLLSSLTHIGIIGFSLLNLIIFRILKRITFSNHSDEQFFKINFLFIFIFGSLFQFITYGPFWLMMGYLNVQFKKGLID